MRRGFQATSAVRTLLDVSCRQALTEAVVVADMALHEGVVKPEELAASLRGYQGAWGIRSLRQVARHAEPKAESPMETRMRMLVVLNGLRRPEAQVSIYDAQGEFLGRPDLYYPAEKLGLEYDGGTHRISLVEDNRRQNRLLDVGVRLLRFTAADIYTSPDNVVALIRAQLEGSVHTTAV